MRLDGGQQNLSTHTMNDRHLVDTVEDGAIEEQIDIGQRLLTVFAPNIDRRCAERLHVDIDTGTAPPFLRNPTAGLIEAPSLDTDFLAPDVNGHDVPFDIGHPAAGFTRRA